MFESQYDWNSQSPSSIPLVKGQKYWTCNPELKKSVRNGWIHVRNANGEKGYIPLRMLHAPRKNPTLSPSLPELLEEYRNPINEAETSTSPQHKESQDTTLPFTIVNGNPIISPDPPMASDPLKNNTK